MGTPSTKKFLKNQNGYSAEEAALTDTAGAADANRIPALGSTGVLHPTIINATNTSAGAGDAGRTVILDAAGRISNTMMPTGIGADTTSILTSEALSAGDFVNIFNNAGTANVRKSDASTSGKYAHGFVLAGFGSGVSATVYFEGANTSVTGMTPGDVWMSATTPGLATATPPGTAGQVVQYLGIATSATSINVEFGRPIILA